VSLFGATEEEEEEDEEPEEPEKPEEDEAAEGADGAVSPSGLTSAVPSGIDTPDHIELRKEGRRADDEGPKELYKVIQQKDVSVTAQGQQNHLLLLGSAC
jgi:splicing factor 3B subunit 2